MVVKGKKTRKKRRKFDIEQKEVKEKRTKKW